MFPSLEKSGFRRTLWNCSVCAQVGVYNHRKKGVYMRCHLAWDLMEDLEKSWSTGICYLAAFMLCKTFAENELLQVSQSNDCWNYRNMFSHLLCGVSQWVEGLISVLLPLILQWPQESSVKPRTSLKYFLHTVRDGTCLKDLAVSLKNSQYSHYHIKYEEVRHWWYLWFIPMCKVQSVSSDMQSSALPLVMSSQPLEKMFRFD